MTFKYNGSPFTPRRGWNAPQACHYSPAHGLRFVAFKTPRAFTLEAYGRTHSISLQARGICTVRPTTTTCSQFTFPGVGPEDFRAGSAIGISPYGDPDPIETHDAIMRRCPIALNDPGSGRVLGVKNVDATGYALDGFTQLKGYAPNTGIKRYDDQHGVRAYRVGLLHKRDPFVDMDLAALLLDWKLAWLPRMDEMLAGPAGMGHGNAGRALAWGVYLAVLRQDSATCDKARAVVRHIQDPNTGLLQRLRQGEFFGSPHPWSPVSEGGSGVPAGVDVAQGIEAAMHVLVLFELGMPNEAWKLADTLLAAPTRKWIDCRDGKGIGVHGADPFHAWFAIGRAAKANATRGRAYALKWPVPKPAYMGGAAGPYATIPLVKGALTSWGDVGKSRLALEYL